MVVVFGGRRVGSGDSLNIVVFQPIQFMYCPSYLTRVSTNTTTAAVQLRPTWSLPP